MDDATLTLWRVVASVGIDVGFALLVGAMSTAALLHGAPSAWAAQRARGAQILLAVAGAATLLASLAWMWAQAIAITDLAPWPAMASAGSVVAGTQFGRAWAPGALALAMCTGLAAARGGRPPTRLVALAVALAALLIAASRASAGHAGANGVGLATLVMTVHLLAIGVWAGAVFVAALVVLRGDTGERADRARYLARLSSLATGALGLVVLSGAFSAWRELGATLAPLAPGAASTWGLTLDIKLALVAFAVALGGFNRVVTLPRLLAALESTQAPIERHWRRFARVLRVEAVVLLAVLIAAALLGNGEPPAV